jgi:hypothetical protein
VWMEKSDSPERLGHTDYNKTGIWEIKGEKLLLREGFRISIHLLRIRIWIGSSTMMNIDPHPIRIRIQGFYDREIKGEKLLLREGFRIRINLLRIRIWIGSSIMMNTDPHPIRIRIQSFYDQKLEGLHKGRPSYKRSFQFSKENIQHFKT